MTEEPVPRSWLTSEVLLDPFLFRDAAAALAAGSGQDGELAARRLVDDRLTRMVHWPRGLDYAQIADDLAALGRDDDAALLCRLAGTDGLLLEAQARWNTRYDSRAETSAEREARLLIDAGLIDFDPAGPYPGIDGSLYWPGYTSLEYGPVQAPVVAVAGRGLRELVTGFDNDAAVQRWLHDRGPMASGPLEAPDVSALPRAMAEEHILARLLRRHDDMRALAARVPPATFTADARYDIYAAIITVASRGQPWDARHVDAELGNRINWVPSWALPRYGGHSAPWAHAYLHRLDVTEPVSYAVSRLVAEDTRARLAARGQDAGRQPSVRTAAAPRPLPEIERWRRYTAQPADRPAPEHRRPGPSPEHDGPAPRW